MQVGFNWLPSHKGIMFDVTNAMTGFNSVAFKVYQHRMARCIHICSNNSFEEYLILYGLGYMRDIPHGSYILDIPQ